MRSARQGACLRCYNPPEKIVPDAEARRRLKNMADNELGGLANMAEITVQEAKEWGDTGRCGIPGERLLPFLRIAVGEHPFAVGFVSVMAGTMLAGELVKDYMNCPARVGVGSTPPASSSIHRSPKSTAPAHLVTRIALCAKQTRSLAKHGTSGTMGYCPNASE